jgi:hypothetical protein
MDDIILLHIPFSGSGCLVIELGRCVEKLSAIRFPCAWLVVCRMPPEIEQLATPG